MLLGETLCEPDHARAALGRRRENHLRAERAHDLAPLDRERLDHRRDERIALRGADHRERDARVARRCLDHRLPRLDRAAALGSLGRAEAALEISPPALLIVGETARFAERYSWFAPSKLEVFEPESAEPRARVSY